MRWEKRPGWILILMGFISYKNNLRLGSDIITFSEKKWYSEGSKAYP